MRMAEEGEKVEEEGKEQCVIECVSECVCVCVYNMYLGIVA